MTKWIRSSLKYPCPVCNRTKDGDCRTSEDEGLVLCHSEINSRVPGEQLGDYIWIGTTEDYLWGKWIKPSSQPSKNPDYRPVGQSFEFPYTNADGTVICTKMRIYQRQPDGLVKKKDWWEPTGVQNNDLVPYRYLEAVAALQADPTLPLLIDESELTADELWKLGIPAIAFGRSIKDSRIRKLLSGYEDRLVICVDRDQPGVQKASRYLKLFPMAKQLKPYPESAFWQPEWLPASGGLDIRDWILDERLTRDQILAAVQSAIADEVEALISTLSAKADLNGQEKRSYFHSSPEAGLIWETWEKGARSQVRIGNHLAAIAYVDNPDETGAALYLEFITLRGQTRRWLLKRNGLVSNANTLIDELMGRGYWFTLSHITKLRRYLAELGTDVVKTYTVTERTGWINGSFVLENRTYGDDSIRFGDIEPVKDSAYELKGTVESWKSEVASLATGNSRLIFALGCAFAAPLAPILDVESGGFHLYGATSTGKTSMLKIATSVMGRPSKGIKLWRATANGLEGVASAHNNLLLPLDEIGQAEPKDVGQAAYMLANGQGKTRAKRNGDATPPKTWNTLYLSTGEVTLTHYLKSANIAIKGGQEVRMPDIPACPGKGYGVLESIGEFANPAEFIRALELRVEKNCGAALDAFLKRLTLNAESEEWCKAQHKRLWDISHGLRAVSPGEETIGRVSLRFALVQVALEVAHIYGLLPFPREQITWAVNTLFEDWMNARGGAGSIEMKQALERIEHLFVSCEHGDRIYQANLKPEEQTVRNLLAYRKKDEFEDEFEFWVPNSVFNSEIASGVDRAELIKELQMRGWLKPPGTDGKASLGRRINGKLIRVYVFNPFWRG